MKIRPAQPQDAAGIAKVQVDSWRVSYRGIIADSVLANLSYAERETGWTRALTEEADQLDFYIAEAEDREIVGFALGGALRDAISGYNGELLAVYLLQKAQRSGYGRALVKAVARSMIERGFDAMAVWVLKDNHPARGFYEALGGQLLTEKITRIGEDDLAEVSYGWPDMRLLIESH